MQRVVPANLVDRDNVRVLNARGGSGLALEAIDESLIGEWPGGEELQRHLPIERAFARPVDHAHTTLADLLDQIVVAEVALIGIVEVDVDRCARQKPGNARGGRVERDREGTGPQQEIREWSRRLPAATVARFRIRIIAHGQTRRCAASSMRCPGTGWQAAIPARGGTRDGSCGCLPDPRLENPTGVGSCRRLPASLAAPAGPRTARRDAGTQVHEPRTRPRPRCGSPRPRPIRPRRRA